MGQKYYIEATQYPFSGNYEWYYATDSLFTFIHKLLYAMSHYRIVNVNIRRF